MMKILPLIFAAGFAFTAPAHAEITFSCAAIKSCQARKTVWDGKHWKTEYAKELQIEKLCRGESRDLQLEPELGISVSVFAADPSSENPIEQGSWLGVDLYTTKRTSIVASAKAPVGATSLDFSHRLGSKPSTFVEITCLKK